MSLPGINFSKCSLFLASSLLLAQVILLGSAYAGSPTTREVGGSVAKMVTPHKPEPQDYSLVISGGISLGAYEAGYNWALIKLMKHSMEEKTISPLKKVRLVGVTGASAGNVNALMTVVHWCGNIPNDITDNLFWETWIPIGMDTLFPGRIALDSEDKDTYWKRYVNVYKGIVPEQKLTRFYSSKDNYPSYDKEDGLLTRKATDYITNKLVKLLGDDIYADCDLTMGITLTKANPAVVTIGGGVNKKKAKSQKFVLPLTVTSDKNGKLLIKMQKLDQERIANISSDYWITRAGHVLELPSDTGKGKGLTVSLDALQKAVKASAAFPIAFGPVTVPMCGQRLQRHENDGNLDGVYFCPDRKVVYEQFIDGGTFDNIPLGLAALQQKRKPPPLAVADNLSDTTAYLFIDPNNARLHKKEELVLDNGSHKSFEKFWVSYLGNFIASASDAELVNTIWKYKDISGNFRISNRYSPIVGEYLGHFGAFFDRPFREYDYYAGVYDAMRNIASHNCERTFAKGEKLSEEICEIAEDMQYFAKHLGLLDVDSDNNSKHKDAGYVFRNLALHELHDREEIQRKLFCTELEHSNRPKTQWDWLCELPKEPFNKNISRIMKALFAVEKKQVDISILKNKKTHKACVNGNGFTPFVDCINKQGYKEKNEIQGEDGVTYNKEEYMKLTTELGFNQGVTNKFIAEAMDRLASVEREDDAVKGELYSDALKFIVHKAIDTSGAHFSTWYKPSSWKFNFDPSTVPDDRYEIGHLLSRITPYRLGVNGSEGGLVAGYEPTIYLNKFFRLSFPIEYIEANKIDQSFFSAGPMFTYYAKSIAIPALSIGIPHFQELHDNAENSWGARIKVGLIFGYFSVSYATRDINNIAENDFWMISIDDFNGFIYRIFSIGTTSGNQ